MENLSSSLPKKIHNGGSGNGFTGKTAYDDVFGGPPKFGMPTFSPRVEDYSEIFGGFHASRASSVPVLDLPPVADAEVLFDFRSSMFDYSEVFGGFDGLDFAVSYEELFFDQSKGGDESSEEAWTSAGTESLSEETYPSADSKENQSLSNEDCRSFEGGRQFNISYHKANQRSQDDMSNGTHVTHIHDIPGVTFVVDEITPSKKTEYEYPPSLVINDINHSVDFSGGEVEGKHLRKTILHSLNSSAGSRTFEKDFRPQRTYAQYDSHSNEMFVGISEISLRTEPSHLPPPSRPPPIIDARKGDSKELDFNPVATRNYAFEGTGGDSSPPFFDVEVDASSSAAVSAAAMKEAMEKAEAKMKSAKELMERKKEGFQKVRTREENGKKLTVTHRNEESERKVTKVCEPGEAEISIEIQQKENKMEVREAMKHKGREQKLKDADRRMENENRLAEVREREENEKRLKEMFEREEYERRLKEALEQAENEKILGEALERAENEKRLKQVLEKEENEKRLKEQVETEKKQKQAREREENEKKLKEALEREKNEKRSKEKLEREEKEKKQKEACEREENEKKRNEALEREGNEKRLKEALEREENAWKQKMADERTENVRKMKEVLEREEVEKRLKEANQRLKEAHEREKYEKKMKEVVEQKEIDERSRQAGAWEKNENKLEDVGERGQRGLHKADEDLARDENEEKLKQTQGTQAHIVGEKLNASDKACKMGKNKNLRATQVVCKHKERNVELEATQELLVDEENEEMRTKSKDGDYEVQAVEKANVLVGDRFKASGMAQDDLQREEIQERIKDAIKSQLLSENVKRSDEAVIDIEQTCVENIEVAQKAFESDPNNTVKKVTYEWEKGGKNTKRAQMASDQEGNKEKLISTQGVNEGFVNGKKMESVQSTISEGRGNTKKTAQQVTTSRSLERKEQNVNVTFTSEEREKEERAKREKELEKDRRELEKDRRELEKDRLRKIEEEREREREREKDRMAVERATLDAREKAYSEVRERAERAAVERATAEARQRAMTEARERLEKVCAEAREKSLAGKVSAEARLRAERAAVERATAEARERAFEKAMAEKASFEARERFERSASSSGLRYPYSVYGASYNTEKSEGVEGESAQRCKARLERHRRTAERAAKALAERNMRDLQAQREQAERNRISETLDADVKRWSSGKERNLRALLSTLQYILGPDCGWQPIPLTEVITAAAVKKAYRKATLCVHPDKLQQRGASIPQKYVCEKVFDLLKEAWNKFNSEER